MSVASEITRIQGAKNSLKTKLNAKNDEQHQITNETIDNYGDFVDSIEVIEQATIEGESLGLSDTKAIPYSDYVVKGKSEQETRSGKNLLNINLISNSNFKYNNGLKLIRGDGKFRTLTINLPQTYQSGSYYLSYEIVSSTLSNINKVGAELLSNGSGITNKTFTNNGVYFNASSTFNQIYFYISSSEDTSAEIILDNVQLEQGTTASSYELYGASPSPDYPSEIHSVADDVNLFNKEATVLGSANCTYTYENGVYTITNTNSSNPVLVLSNVLPKGSYILNSDVSLSQATQIRNSNGDTLANCGSNYQNKTFEISSNADRIYFNWATTSNPITLNLNSLKIQKGSIATSYSPYNQGTVTIKQRGTTESNDYTIQTSPLRSLPNGVKDTIEEDGIHRRIGRIVLDGTENWTDLWVSNNGKYEYQCIDALTDSKRQTGATNNIICQSNYYIATHYDGGTGSLWNLRSNDDYPYLIAITDNINSTAGKISIKNKDITTLSEFKTWLSTHNTEVIYELAEEVIEPLTQNQANTMLDIIHTGSYEGTTNIYTDEEIKPTIGVEYYKKG